MSDTKLQLDVVHDDAFLERRAAQSKRAKEKADNAEFAAFIVCCLPAIIALIALPLWTNMPERSRTFGQWIAGVALGGFIIFCIIAAFYCFITQYKPLTIRFNSWRQAQEHWFCPECRQHLPTMLSWQCPRCLQINGGDANHSYFGTCTRCEQAPDAVICPRCRRTIGLASEGPYLSIAVVATRSITPSKNNSQHSGEEINLMSAWVE